MAVMVQMKDCLDRAFAGKMPAPSKKWKAFVGLSSKTHLPILVLYHYHHKVLEYDINYHVYLHEWWEKRADKRGLDSAKEYLEERYKKLKGDRE